MSKKLFIFTSIFILFYLFIKDDVFEDKTISIGTSIPNTGIIKSWGEAVYSGANAYFSYTNENNIIKNKKINF